MLTYCVRSDLIVLLPVAKVHPSQKRGGRDKFIDRDHPWMPAPLSAWAAAMQAVDRSGVARPSSELWGYWVPDPSLLIGPENPERVQRYVMNWLRIREGWLYLLGLPDTPATRVGAQWWRDYLNGDTANPTPEQHTRRAEHLEKVKSVFIRAFTM